MDDNFELDLEFTGVEETELADQSEEVVGAEETEIADQSESNSESSEEGKSSQDSAFAAMRREKEELQRQLDEAKRGSSELEETLKMFFDGDDFESLNQNARAYAEAMKTAQGEDRAVTDEDIENAHAILAAERELADLRAENDRLKNEAKDREVTQAMEESLRELTELSDGKIKSFDDVSRDFLDLIGSGQLTTRQAYYASQAMELDSKVIPPNGTGKVGNTKIESEFYTSEELDNLTREEVRQNRDKVMRSMAHLYGK